MHTPQCSECPTVFEASRSDARFCSEACRMVARRAREGRERARLVGVARRLAAAVLSSPSASADLVALAADARRVTASQP